MDTLEHNCNCGQYDTPPPPPQKNQEKKEKAASIGKVKFIQI